MGRQSRVVRHGVRTHSSRRVPEYVLTLNGVTSTPFLIIDIQNPLSLLCCIALILMDTGCLVLLDNCVPSPLPHVDSMAIRPACSC